MKRILVLQDLTDPRMTVRMILDPAVSAREAELLIESTKGDRMPFRITRDELVEDAEAAKIQLERGPTETHEALVMLATAQKLVELEKLAGIDLITKKRVPVPSTRSLH